ncbi:MAG: two-component sensor histidine kinase [Candidatus Dojkabacteria bacterium]|nr:MAG: two-component sensor histidine kinase [Candidatus Dojkabacteria bacterium]GIW57396.1 MAG: two-component sensor histidine kinase [Candidatus Dojkabacteria bacterium]
MKREYHKKRIQLTIVYSIILLSVIIFFSVILWQSQERQIDRFLDSPRMRFIRRFSDDEYNRIKAITDEVKFENFINLIMLDSVLIIISVALSYYLSGKTLEPVFSALDRQKQFISDASHDLKTPLTNIKTEAEVLTRNPSTTLEEYQTFATNVVNDIDRLNKLIDSMLEAARLEHLVVHLQDIDLKDLMREILNDFRSRIQEKNLELHEEYPDDDIVIKSDKKLLTRLIYVIIDNSIKYNKENGSVRIKIYKSASNTYLAIQDTGIGIEKSKIKHIFDRFYRVAEDRHTEGFGLGLAIAKEIADKLHIKMTVKSKVDVGTEFILTFN